MSSFELHLGRKARPPDRHAELPRRSSTSAPRRTSPSDPRLVPGLGAALAPRRRRIGPGVRRQPLRRRHLPEGPEAQPGRRRLAAARRACRRIRSKAAFAAWAAAGLPLVPTTKLPPRDARGRTVWVTGAAESRPHRLPVADPPLRRSERRVPVRAAGRGDGGRRALRRDALRRRRQCSGATAASAAPSTSMVEEFGLRQRAAVRLATIVRGADTARLGSRAGSGGPACRVARPFAHVFRRPRAARGRHAALRRLLSLVPRRHGRDA